MRAFFLRWFAPPVFPGDEEKTNRAQLLATALVTLSFFGLLAAIGLILSGVALNARIIMIFSFILCNLAIYRLVLRGQIRWMDLLVLAEVYLFTTISLASLGTVRAPLTLLYLYIIILAGALYQRRGVWTTTLACSLAVGGLILAENFGLLPAPNNRTNIIQWVSLTFLFGLTGSLALLATQQVRSALLHLCQESAERQKTEQALRASDALFRAVVEHSGEGLVMLDRERRIKYISPSYERVNGYPPAENVGLPGPDFIHPEDQAVAAELFKRCLQNPKQPQTAEYRLRHKQGGWVWVESTANNLLDDPAVGAVVFNTRDISERKRMQASLQERTRYIETIMENAPIGFAVRSGDDGSIRYVSGRFEDIYGVPPGALTSARAFRAAVLHGRANPPLNGEDGGPYHESVPVQLKSGEIRYLTTTTTHLPEQNLLLYTAQDTTAHIQAEEAQRASEALFRAVVDHSSDGILLLDNHARIKYSSPSFKRLCGYTPADLAGSDSFSFIHPEDLAAAKAAFNQARHSPLDVQAIEYRMRHKDGRWVWLETTTASLLYDPHVQAVVLNSRDITERKQHELELRAITTLSAALRSAPNRATMLPVILQQAAGLANCETVAIQIIDPASGEALVEAACGVWQGMVSQRQAKGSGLNAAIAASLRPFYTTNLEDEPRLHYPTTEHFGIRGAAGLPLLAQGQLIGFLWGGSFGEISDSELRVLAAMADIAANAIHRATLHGQALQLADDLALAYDTTLQGWASALELRDQETEGHSRRVVTLVLQLAERMGVPAQDLVHIRRGAILHDIGKMGVPDAILHKPGPLNAEEWAVMRRHPGDAYKLLHPIQYLRPALDIPYCHHEKWDGSGYPRGLKGEEIPLAARMFAVVDIWDALRFDRPYRAAWSEERVRAYLREQSSTHLDPRVVEAFLAMLSGS